MHIPKDKRNTAVFILIIAAGLVLRLWGLGFGLPFQYHQDEPIIVNHAIAFGSGDLNPHFFAVPPLTSYMLFFVYGMFFLVSFFSGAVTSAEGFALDFISDPTIFYLLGRLFIGVIPGILCVIMVFVVSRRFLSEREALISAAVMSFSFLNVVNSHYIYTDMLLVLFTVAAFNSFYSLYLSPSFKNYCVSGLFIGLATGTKYNAALLIPVFIYLHQVSINTRRERSVFSGRLWAGLGASAVSFIMVNPFMLLDHRGFIESFLKQSRAFWYTGWTLHLTRSLTQGLSLPVTVLGIAGLAMFFSRGRWGRVLAAFPVIFYILLVFRSQNFSRYVLPMVPFLAIGCAYSVNSMYVFLRKHTVFFRPGAVLCLATLLVILPTTVKAIKADMLFASVDTRFIAAEWIKRNIDEGAGIACDSTVFRPALRQPYSQILGKRAYVDRQPDLGELKSRKLSLQLRAAGSRKEKSFPLFFLSETPDTEGQFLDTIPSLPFDAGELEAGMVEYVVVNSQTSSPVKKRFLVELDKRAALIAEFSPYIDGKYRQTGDYIASTGMPLMDEEIFSRNRPGPALRIYKIR